MWNSWWLMYLNTLIRALFTVINLEYKSWIFNFTCCFMLISTQVSQLVCSKDQY